MSNSIQFEENSFSSTPKKIQKRNGMTDMLVQNGVAKNAAEATMILGALIIICLIATAAVIFFSMKEDVVYVVEPPLAEQVPNFQ